MLLALSAASCDVDSSSGGWRRAGLGELRVGEARLVLLELRLGHRQIGLVLVDHGLIGAGVDLGADLALLDLGIVVAIQLLE